MRIIFLLMLSLGVFADDDYSKIDYKVQQLTPSIYMLEGAGGNITAVIGSEGTFLVDDDFAPMADKLVKQLKALNGSSPRFIVNTHFHYDHTGGNEVFGSTATIIAAAGVRQRLSTEQVLWGEKHPAAPRQAWPRWNFRESMIMSLNSIAIDMIHYPSGHTDGDTVVYFDNGKVISMGDLYFAGMFPIFHPEHKGSLYGYIQNIEAVLARAPAGAKIVPGHGPVTGREELATYARMIRSSIATVKSGMRRGETLEQLQKAGLDPEWEPYSHGYVSTERWIKEIYDGLNR